jgi:hypothetical protein
MKSYAPVGGLIVRLVYKEFERLLKESVELPSPNFVGGTEENHE